MEMDAGGGGGGRRKRMPSKESAKALHMGKDALLLNLK